MTESDLKRPPIEETKEVREESLVQVPAEDRVEAERSAQRLRLALGRPVTPAPEMESLPSLSAEDVMRTHHSKRKRVSCVSVVPSEKNGMRLLF